MSAFEYLSVALSFVLGLGVTHLLASASRLFTRRHQVEFDWVPIVWAFTIFTHQIHFWWVVFALSEQPQWSFVAFLMLLSFALFLFLGGALVLPDVDAGEEIQLTAYFERTGRWALLAVFGYDFLGIPFDYLLYDVPLFSGVNAFRLPYLVALAVVFFTGSQMLRRSLTVAYLAGLIVWIVQLAPASY